MPKGKKKKVSEAEFDRMMRSPGGVTFKDGKPVEAPAPKKRASQKPSRIERGMKTMQKLVTDPLGIHERSRKRKKGR